MDLYNYIQSLKEYFYSVRLHQEIILIDIKFPIKWIIKEVINLKPGTTQLKENDKSDNHQLVSFYCEFNEKSVDLLMKDINRVIKYNKDQEEKINLLNLKRMELEKIFQSNDVNALRALEFNFGLSNDGEPPLEKLPKTDEKK
mgnify:CR=1 FL=1